MCMVRLLTGQINFPPSSGHNGSFSSLINHAFFWMPALQWTFRIPRWDSYLPSSDLWPAFAWW